MLVASLRHSWDTESLRGDGVQALRNVHASGVDLIEEAEPLVRSDPT